jgi:heme-degrading monooxygenase HmoA
MAIARIWRTRIDKQRADEYERFADQESLPMFRAHEGLIGVIFGGAEDDRVVISLWGSAHDVAALDASPIYQQTVERIEATGFIVGPSSVEVFAVHGGEIDGAL